MNRFYVVIFALFGLAVMPLAAQATHKPGHQQPGGGQGTGLTITAKPNPFTFGSKASITGKLSGTTTSGQTVALEAMPFPFTAAYKTVTTALTASNGAYSFSVGGRVNTRYRTSSGGIKSPEMLLRVRLAVGVAISDSTPKRGAYVKFAGTVRPQEDGASVLIQRRTSTGSYKTVARTKALDVVGQSYSRYSRRIRVSSDGVYRVRALTLDANRILSGTSRLRRIAVH